MKLGVAQWIYCGEELETSLKRISSCGFDGVGIKGEPEEVDVEKTKELLNSYKLEPAAVNGIPTLDRDLISPKESVRKNTIEYMKECVNLISKIGGNLYSGVIPTVRKEPKGKKEKEWQWAVEGIKEVAEYSADYDVKLAIEPLNRFETYFIRKTDQALQLIEDINKENVGISLDYFHLNIEESSIEHAIKKAGDNLLNFDVADNNREVPGMGQANWEKVLNLLREIRYDNYLMLEFLPPVDRSPHGSTRYEYPEEKGFREVLIAHGSARMTKEYYDESTKFAINYLKKFI